MMASNDTSNNSTNLYPNGSQSSGLAVGLPLFFVVSAVVIGSMAYFYFRQRKSKRETLEGRHSKPAGSQNPGLIGSSRQISESPVYENFSKRPSDIIATDQHSNMDLASHR